MRPRLLTALAAAGLVSIALLAACAADARTPVDSRFAVDGPITIVIQADEATITLVPSVAGAVIITGSIDPQRYSYSATSDGRTVRIELLRERSLLALVRSGTASIRVRVPPGSDYEIVAAESSVTVESGGLTSGSIETTGAVVVVQGGEGSLRIRNRSGSVAVAGHRGALDILTSGASVDVVDHAGGSVTIVTNDAPIDYMGTIEAGEPNALTTTNAGITVRLTGEPSITLDAATTNGTITSRYAILDVQRTPAELRGRIAGGEATLTLRTTNGSIEVIPAEAP